MKLIDSLGSSLLVTGYRKELSVVCIGPRGRTPRSHAQALHTLCPLTPPARMTSLVPLRASKLFLQVIRSTITEFKVFLPPPHYLPSHCMLYIPLYVHRYLYLYTYLVGRKNPHHCIAVKSV